MEPIDPRFYEVLLLWIIESAIIAYSIKFVLVACYTAAIILGS